MFCRIPCGRPEQPHSWLYELPPVETGTTPPVKIIRALAGEKEKDVTPTAQERARGIVEQWCTQIDPETYLMGDDGPRLVKDLAAALEQVERETIERAYDSIAMMSCGCAHKIRALAGV